MIRVILAIAGFASVLLCASYASADPYFQQNVWASPIYDRKAVCGYPPDTQIIIQTGDLKGGWGYYPPDTFLVVEGTGYGTYYNDDFWGSNRSLIGAKSSDGCFRIIVFASYWLAPGTADISVDAQVIDNDVPFGGTLVSLSGLPGESYSVHAIHRAGALKATQTELYLFDDQWNRRLYDDQSGAGQQATLYEEYIDSGDIILVASDSTATEGYADLAINDCIDDPDRAPFPGRCGNWGYDHDDDFLADSLEIDLGTKQLDFNTDDDALFDYYEVIGRFNPEGDQDVYESQTYSEIGANPRRRDIFFEIDRNDAEPGPIYGSLTEVQDVYNDLPLIINDDGSVGISIHADIGKPCPNDPALCGDWGGVDTGLVYGNQGEPSLGDYVRDPQYTLLRQEGYFYEMRWGIFHYVYVSGPPYGGGGAAEAPGASFFIESGSDMCTLTHELGHDLGLQHWGERLTGTAFQMNMKASYPSLMNYSYQCELPGFSTTRSRFSEGRMEPVDHTNLQEATYSSYAASAADMAYLDGRPLYFDLNLDPGTHDVDFNDDNRIGIPGNVNGSITFDVSPVYITDDQGGQGVIGAGWPELYKRAQVASGVPTGGSGLVVEPGSLPYAWAFTPYTDPDPGEDAMIWVRNAPMNGAMPWGTVWFLRGYPNQLAENAETAAVWAPHGDAEVMVLHPETGGGNVLYYLFDTADPDGGSWQAIPNMPSGVNVRSISVTAFVGWVIVVFKDLNAPEDDENVYITMFDLSSGTWTTPTLMEGVISFFTPGIAGTPDGSLYIAIADIFGPGASHDIQFWRKESGSYGDGTGWVRDDFELGFARSGLHTLLDDNPAPVKNRINLVSVPYMDNNRQPVSDGSAYLAAFWNVDRQAGNTPDDWFARRAYTTGYFLPLSDANRWRVKGWRSHRMTVRPFPGHSVAVAVDGGNVMQLFTATSNWNADQDAEAPTADSLWFAPYVSGMPPVNTGVHTDNNDNADIKEYLCESSWRLVYGDAASCYCDYGPDQATWPSGCQQTASLMGETCQ